MKAKEMDAEMLRCLLWLLLQRHGGQITLDRVDLYKAPRRGEILLTDGPHSMTIECVPVGTADKILSGEPTTKKGTK